MTPSALIAELRAEIAAGRIRQEIGRATDSELINWMTTCPQCGCVWTADVLGAMEQAQGLRDCWPAMIAQKKRHACSAVNSCGRS